LWTTKCGFRLTLFSFCLSSAGYLNVARKGMASAHRERQSEALQHASVAPRELIETPAKVVGRSKF
jgi:hypothetical protein